MAPHVDLEQNMSTAGIGLLYPGLSTNPDQPLHHQSCEGLAGHRVPSQPAEEDPGTIDTARTAGPDGTHIGIPHWVSTPAGEAVPAINGHVSIDNTSAAQARPEPADDERRRAFDRPYVAAKDNLLWARRPVPASQPQPHRASCIPYAGAGPVPADASATEAPTSRRSFLDLAPEIRNHISGYACRWPDSRALYSQYSRQIDEYYAARRAGDTAMPFPVWQGRLKGFTILLLCKQITRECRAILESCFLVIDRLPPWPKGGLQPVPLVKFITRETLQSVKRLELRFTLTQGEDGSGWYAEKIVDEIVGILLDKNSFRELRIVLNMTCMHDKDLWGKESICIQRIRVKIHKLRCENPTWWAPGAISSEAWVVRGLKAHRIRLHFFDSLEPRHLLWKVNTFRDGVLEAVRYPDERVWPGSILEFL